jgi:hypothetical protein
MHIMQYPGNRKKRNFHNKTGGGKTNRRPFCNCSKNTGFPVSLCLFYCRMAFNFHPSNPACASTGIVIDDSMRGAELARWICVLPGAKAQE